MIFTIWLIPLFSIYQKLFDILVTKFRNYSKTKEMERQKTFKAVIKNLKPKNDSGDRVKFLNLGVIVHAIYLLLTYKTLAIWLVEKSIILAAL